MQPSPQTLFHAMGIRDLMARDREGKPYHLMNDGSPIRTLFEAKEFA
jgi:hypothetical protein